MAIRFDSFMINNKIFVVKSLQCNVMITCVTCAKYLQTRENQEEKSFWKSEKEREKRKREKRERGEKKSGHGLTIERIS